jgi:hypothetical protein
MTAMRPEEVMAAILARYPGVVPKASWGETSLFVNPGGQLTSGVYFCTLKDHDGAHDRAARLDRDGVYRLALGLPQATYGQWFGARPARPPKGGVVDTGHDFTQLNLLMPHPVYAWMGWVQLLSPSRETFEALLPLLDEAHQAALATATRRIATRNRPVRSLA